MAAIRLENKFLFYAEEPWRSMRASLIQSYLRISRTNSAVAYIYPRCFAFAIGLDNMNLVAKLQHRT